MDDVKPSEHARFSAGTLAGGIALGLLVFGLVDLAVGLSRPGPEARSGQELLHAAMIALGHGGLLAVLIWIGTIIVRRLGDVVGTRTRLVGPLAFASLIFSLAILYIHVDTLGGRRFRTHPRYDQILWTFRIATPILVFVALAIVRVVVRRGIHRRRFARGAAAFFALTGIALMVANTRVLVGLYPGFHQQLVGMAIFAFVVAGVLVVTGRTWLTILTVLLALGAVGGSFAARKQDDFLTASSLSSSRAPNTQEFATHFEPLFRRLVKPPELGITVFKGSLDFDDAASAARAQAFLDDAIPQRRSFNVLLVAIDTLRADRVGFLGGRDRVTPNLDKLAASPSSWVFEHAYTSYPTSNFAYASVLSGLLPRSTRTYANLRKRDWKFPDDLTLPTLLGRSGWNSIGVTAFDRSTAHDPEYFDPLREGFAVYNPDQTEAAADASHVTDSALETIAEATARPFLLWSQYMDPHDPYDPHDGFIFGDTEIDRYDSEIAWADHHVGRLLDGIRSRNELERTIVVFFSDHGEEFREHGKRFHNSAVYEQQIRVPLLIHVPGLKGRHVKATVSTTDILSTVAALVGVDDPVRRHGRNLVPLMLSEGPEPAGWAHAEFFGRHGGQLVRNPRTVIRGRDKLIWNRKRETYELYDLAGDALERRNLLTAEPETFAEMRGLLKKVDESIDGYHGQDVVATEGAADLASWRKDLDAALEAIAGDDDKASNAGVARARKLLFDYAGDPSGDAQQALGAKGLDELSTRVIRLHDDADPKQRSIRRRLRLLVALLRRPTAREFFERCLEEERGRDTPEMARALAMIGGDKGRPALVKAADSVAVDYRTAMVGLAHLGADEVKLWVDPCLTVRGHWAQVANMVSALPKIGAPNVGRSVRDYIQESLWTQPPIQRRLAQTLRHVPNDSDALWLLVRLSTSEEILVAEAAAASLAELRIAPDRLAAMTQVVDAARDADNAARNLSYDLAFGHYRTAIEKASAIAGPVGFNAALRLRFARYLQLEDHRDEARDVLTKVRDAAPNEADRSLAARRLELIDAPARILDAGTFGATVTDVSVPAKVRPMFAFPVTFRVTNKGSVPWSGGYWRFYSRFGLRWRGEDGKLLPLAPVKPWAYLPPRGLAPGESLDVRLIGIAPRGKPYRARPVLVFEQPWFEAPNDGVIYEHPDFIDVTHRLRRG